MAALHLVNHADALPACLALAAPDDAVLLIEDGVYAGVTGAAGPARELRALEVDVRARGLGGRLADGVRTISDEQFVTLVEAHSPVVTWRR